jgi:hypothetical protein
MYGRYFLVEILNMHRPAGLVHLMLRTAPDPQAILLRQHEQWLYKNRPPSGSV